jgi:ribonuclease R
MGGPGRVVVRAGGSGRGAATVRASAGDLVLVELAPKGAGAFVTRVIGRPDVARDLIEAMMLDRGLSRGFVPALEAEARAAEERVRRQEWGRRDLRALPTFTIDPVSARDFDDAISAEPMGSGGTRMWVHIADVSAHVPEGSPLDLEARRRATSVYVPGAVEPMLPHALSSEACSLMPNVERAAVTVEMELEGSQVRRASFYRSLIRSDARLDYEQVDRIFAGTERASEPWGASLAAARVAAAALQDRRERSGALVVDSEEPEFAFDEEGAVTGVEGRIQTESHRLIEHVMITANEAVAAHLQERGAPCLYRVHERPDPERIERLADQLATLEVPTPPIPENMSSTQAAELVGLISRRVAEHVARTGRGRIALNSLILRSLKQAYYSPENLGHAGLWSPCYCHFTSPIRRYPDLVCHRALLAGLGGVEPAPRARDMTELGVWTSEREREAMTIERDGDDIARAFALRRLLYEGDPDRDFDGEITGLIPAGAFIAFSASPVGADEGEEGTLAPGALAPPFEGMLPLRMMGVPTEEPQRRSSNQRRHRREGAGGGSGEREWWELNEEGTILRGERTGASIRLGDGIQVRVARVDTVRGRVDLLPAG